MIGEPSESVNPYASPEGLETAAGRDLKRVLTATFVIDEAWHQKAGGLPTARQQDICSYIAIGILLVGAVGGMIASDSNFAPDLISGFLFGGMIAVFVVFAFGAVVSYGLSAWNQRFMPSQWPGGELLVEVSNDRLTLTGRNFHHSFAAREMRQLAFAKKVTFHAIGSNLRFYVPSSADFGEDDFASWAKTIAARIK